MSEKLYSSDAEYHADHSRLSATMIKTFARSVPEYHARFVTRQLHNAPTPAMALGTAVHELLLQPDDWQSRLAIAPDLDRRTKLGKEAWSDFVKESAGRTVVDSAAADVAHAMVASIRSVPLCSFLLDGDGIAERPIHWTDEATGLECRAKPDLLLTGPQTVVELKTTSDASAHGFARSVWTLAYHLQASHYLAGTGAKRLVWIVVSSSPPHEVALFELDPLSVGAAARHYRRVMAEIAGCQASGTWPTVPQVVEQITLPAWALNS